MDNSQQYKKAIAGYGVSDPSVKFDDIMLYDYNEKYVPGNAIVEECAKQAQAINPSDEGDRKKEQRLRILAGIIRSMQSVGLIE